MLLTSRPAPPGQQRDNGRCLRLGVLVPRPSQSREDQGGDGQGHIADNKPYRSMAIVGMVKLSHVSDFLTHTRVFSKFSEVALPRA
jgi:hypothetical protein